MAFEIRKEALSDCGMSAEGEMRFLKFLQDGNKECQLHLLKVHRRYLMESLRKVQKQVDRTDLLIDEIRADGKM